MIPSQLIQGPYEPRSIQIGDYITWGSKLLSNSVRVGKVLKSQKTKLGPKEFQVAPILEGAESLEKSKPDAEPIWVLESWCTKVDVEFYRKLHNFHVANLTLIQGLVSRSPGI